ncbi:MAG: hypothetical protein M1829_005811 [Trizodia sp. TS-e1964]|nr:MAG: hypothetical protein M1829_005811 [Trizodia sp. TS-e1964]
MSDPADREERKREYNRLAQREFRRRRKEHLKSLEQLQKEQSSEQTEEIERLRAENAALIRENEGLRSQLYGSSSHMMPPALATSLHAHSRSYSMSPIAGPIDSGGGSPLDEDMISAAMSLAPPISMPPTSAPMLSLGSMVTSHPLLAPQHDLQEAMSVSERSSPGPGQSPLSSVDMAFQPPSFPQAIEQQALMNNGPNFSGHRILVQYDRTKARAFLKEIFRPLLYDSAISSSSQRHLSTLKAMAPSLPRPLQPTKMQLEVPHPIGVDMITSPALRDRLIGAGMELSQSFIRDIGSIVGDAEDTGQVVIWGNDLLDEMAWELSQPVLERWGWLLGREWISRANFWRRQRGASLLSEW